MVMLLQDREVLMRSADANWTYELWEQLPHDEYRYEIIDGELYVSNAPSWEHQQASLVLSSALFTWEGQGRLGAVMAAPGLVFA